RVPKVTVMIGASNGAGNYAMCGRAYGARFLFTWPNARISVMGAEQAATVMTIIKREQLKRSGQELSDADADKIQAPIRAQYEAEGHPYFGTARLWDDGIIEPVHTRAVLAMAFAAAAQAPIGKLHRAVFPV